ncbi:tyrosine-type recombinase/integrase [Actinomadura sp. GTD37]|uniref:tyrosine-type recombinase/integrase n=1 Tax=Actinomadura sp. GTD37 TaxID=1778030 RepID=UPI0035C162ED
MTEDHYGDRITPVMGEVAILDGMPRPSGVRSNGARLTVAPATISPNLRWPGRAAAVDTWLRAYDSPHTRNAYRTDIRRWLDWCDLYGVDPADARRGDVDAYRSELQDTDPPPAVRTVRRRLAAVSSFYRYWVAEGGLDYNPAAHARRPKASSTPGSIALTLAQARQLVDYADSLPDIRPSLVIRLLLETGMRVSELCAAEVTDLALDSGHRTLTIVRKGGIEATTVLTIRTAQALETYLQGRAAGPLLATSGCKKDGTPQPLDRGYVRKLVRRLAREAGLPAEVVERMHPHVLRHTAATLLDEAGIPMQRIQRQLGHADIRQTELYAGHRQELEASPVYVLGGLLAA